VKKTTFAVAGALALALGLIAGVVAALAPSLPLGIDPAVSPEASIGTAPAGHPIVATAHLLTLVLCVVATVGFAREAKRSENDFAAWLAAGATFAAFSSFHYFVFPSLYSQWVYTGDFLRFGFYVLLLVAVTQEIRRYWRGLALLAVLEERRRVARELHDGLAQELAFIVGQSRRLAAGVQDPEALGSVARAAERALEESRQAIVALSRPLGDPLAVVITETARELTARAGLRLECDVEEGIHVPPAMRAALVRIVREAITNVARHGKATCARIELKNGDGIHLRVTDDGVGFDPAKLDGDNRGFGLTSIEERARQFGGSVRIDSSPLGGTSVDVLIP
jgi:signal transduction histidine kinase